MTTRIADPGGLIHITLATDGLQVTGVSISSTRRPDLTRRLFAGRPVGYLLETLPVILSLCATAQATVAARACERAAEIAPSPAQERARDLLVLVETAREHLLRILLGWSEWAGSPPPAWCLASVGRLRTGWQRALYPGGDGLRLGGGHLRPVAATLDALLAELRATIAEVLGVSLEEWHRLDGLESWAAGGQGLAQRVFGEVLTKGWTTLGGAPLAPLPHLSDDALARCLTGPEGDAFATTPEWGGSPRETGALERMHRHPLIAGLLAAGGNGLLTRLAARLAELAEIPGRILALLDDLAPTDPVAVPTAPTGTGLAQVDAARGRLVHWVQLEAGAVVGHRILAPTEWNFHPRGVLWAGLGTLPASGGQLPRLARLLVDAVDPCVECRIEVDVGAA